MKMRHGFFTFVILSIISIVSLANLALAHVGENNYTNNGMMGSFYRGMMGGFGMGFFGWLFMTLIIITLVLFIVWLIKQILKK